MALFNKLEHYLTIALVDPTCEENEYLSLNIFGNEDQLPLASSGDILRVHRLQIQEMPKKINTPDKIQGVGSVSKMGFSWYLIPENGVSSISISSKTFTFTETDLERINAISYWWALNSKNFAIPNKRKGFFFLFIFFFFVQFE